METLTPTPIIIIILPTNNLIINNLVLSYVL